MSTINIYTVQNALEEQGWKLLSDTYKNLKTELKIECPEGHKTMLTFEKWRKHPVCEQCMAGDIYKVKKNKVPKKDTNTTRILALDAATNITGYAIYDNKTLVSYGTYHTNAGLSATERINQVKNWLKAAIEEYEPDFIGVENIQLQSYGPHQSQAQVKTFQTLANLQGVLLDTIFEACIDSDLVYSTEWRQYCDVGSGTGRENKKKQAQDKVKLWYGLDCTQDEADAICIGKYFCNKVKVHTTWGEDI